MASVDALKGPVLVTGGTGFIGANLASSLERSGIEVLAPPRRDLDLLDDDSVTRWLTENPVEAVVHTATTPAHRNAKPEGVTWKNLRMFLNLVRNEQRFSRMIVLGSGAEYDSRHYHPGIREEELGAHVPVDESGFSKYAISRYVELLGSRYLVLRLFGVFGPGEDWEIRFVSNAICKALYDRPITLRQNRKFDYLWIEDLGPIVSHYLSHGSRWPAVNVTPGEPRELLELAKLVLESSGKDLPIEIATPGMGTEYSGDNRRLLAEMPDVRFTPPGPAIGRLWEWYRERRHSIRPEALEHDK